ncbi:MAG TPA: PEPxxWA-CTERM sorting domain-containing protein [Caulobacteraceae bacterium]|nr:PEPxxWA-CTERM sorting domain-containing protein [Caulobacteraceae bacterium]
MSWMMKFAGVAAAAAMFTGLAATQAKAAVYMFTTSGTGSDGSVSASATITTSGNTLTVTLTSLEANPTAAGQLLSGIQILGTGATGSTLTNSAGALVNISGGTATPTGGTIDHWGSTVSGGSIFLATAGTGSVGGMPVDLIIGPGPYTNANSSITVRNPQISQTATFTLMLTGVTNPNITGVNFMFGTGPDFSLPGVPGVPEPATCAMLILGFGMVGAGLRLRRKSVAYA